MHDEPDSYCRQSIVSAGRRRTHREGRPGPQVTPASAAPENPTTAPSIRRRKSAATSGALFVSCREVASRCAGPTDATCDTHSPPAALAKTREGGPSQRPVDLLTDNPASGHHLVKPRPRTVRPRKHPNSETTSRSTVAEHRTGVAGEPINIEDIRRRGQPRPGGPRGRSRCHQAGRKRPARTQRARSVAWTPASTPSQRDQR